MQFSDRMPALFAQGPGSIISKAKTKQNKMDKDKIKRYKNNIQICPKSKSKITKIKAQKN